MTPSLRLAATALALTLAPLAAAAHHRDGHDGGPPADRGERGGAREEGLARGAGSRPCAWGLAGREEACVPPGLADQEVTTDQWIGAPTSTFAEAQEMPEGEVKLIANVDRLGLDALEDGQVYALAGDAIVILDVVEGLAEDGVTPVTTYSYDSTVRRAAFPGRSGG